MGAGLAPTDLEPPVLLDRDLDQRLDCRVDRDLIDTGHRVDDQRVLVGICVGDPDERGQAADVDSIPVRIRSDRVVAFGAVDVDRVGLAVGGRTIERSGEIDIDALEGPSHSRR